MNRYQIADIVMWKARKLNNWKYWQIEGVHERDGKWDYTCRPAMTPTNKITIDYINMGLYDRVIPEGSLKSTEVYEKGLDE